MQGEARVEYISSSLWQTASYLSDHHHHHRLHWMNIQMQRVPGSCYRSLSMVMMMMRKIEAEVERTVETAEIICKPAATRKRANDPKLLSGNDI